MFNKGIQEYINLRYAQLDTTQQITDDLRVLKATWSLPITSKLTPYTYPQLRLHENQGYGATFQNSYDCDLPEDYLHILNCICEFTSSDKCSPNAVFRGANKLNSNQWPHVVDNYYLRPSDSQPYYYIINIDDPVATQNAFPNDQKNINVTKGDEVRYGNTVKPIMLIKCGNGNLQRVYIDYLRAPKYLSIDQSLLDQVVDNSQIIEFPDYVVYEIINKIVSLIMEKEANPRIQTHPQINQSIS